VPFLRHHPRTPTLQRYGANAAVSRSASSALIGDKHLKLSALRRDANYDVPIQALILMEETSVSSLTEATNMLAFQSNPPSLETCAPVMPGNEHAQRPPHGGLVLTAQGRAIHLAG
jgi:hypothetical protein